MDRPSMQKGICGTAATMAAVSCGSHQTAKIDRVIEMPVKNITTCTFGGADLKTLFVTTAASPGERLSGGLFAMQCEVRGQPENKFCAQAVQLVRKLAGAGGTLQRRSR